MLRKSFSGPFDANEHRGMGMELDAKHLTQIAAVTEPATACTQTCLRPDGSITNG